jgi:hypothetical protein
VPLSVDEIAENESACLSDRENEMPVVPQTPTPPRSSLKCIPRWEHHLPSHYILAATPDANSFNIDTQIQTTNTGEVHSQPSLLDSGTMDLFINSSYLQEKCITPKTLSNPIPVYNVDGTPNNLGPIQEIANVVLRYRNHTECTQFALTHLGKSKMILGLCWLRQHNPEINWAMNEVKMSCCPAHCRTCVQEVMEECKVCKAESTKICTCWTGPLPASVEDATDDDSSEHHDLPDLAPNPDSEEDRDDESLEEGDRTFMVLIPAEAEFVRATQSTSQ